MNRFFEGFWEIFKTIVICCAIILPIRYFLVQPFYVKGASMEPNFHEHDYLLVDEISYRFHPPERGDIVVFRYPQDPQEYFIKRVIGLPGETVTIKEGSVYIADSAGTVTRVKEDYLPSFAETVSQSEEPVVLKNDQFFLLGDNRNGSKDSRSFGPVHKNFVIGRVFFRGLPLDKIEVVKSPAYPNEQ